MHPENIIGMVRSRTPAVTDRLRNTLAVGLMVQTSSRPFLQALVNPLAEPREGRGMNSSLAARVLLYAPNTLTSNSIHLILGTCQCLVRAML